MKLQDSILASRYARALFAAARSEKNEDKAREELHRLGQLMRAKPALSLMLRHPLLPAAEKKKKLAGEMGRSLSPSLDRFIALLLAKHRLELLPAILSRFDEAFNEAKGVLALHVKSALPLAEGQIKILQDKLGKAWNGPVTLSVSLDENLIGGLVVLAGDKEWDMSLRGQLARIKQKLGEVAYQ